MLNVNTEKKLFSSKWIGVILAVINFAITLAMDKKAFFNVDYLKSPMYYNVKILNLIAIVVFWQLMFFVAAKIKQQDEYTILFLKVAGAYFVIMMVFLLLTWPGVWRWDELNIYFDATKLKILFFQYWYTSLYYAFCMGLFAFPAGILIVQNFIISLIVGYIVTETYGIIRSKKVYWLYVVFLLPAIIDQNLYPMRTSITGFLVLLLFSSVLFAFIKKTKPSLLMMGKWGALIAICACWRSENISIFVLIPIIICIAFKKQLNLEKISGIVVATLLIFICSQSFQSASGKTDYYSLSGIMEPMAAIISSDFKSGSPQEDLEKIDAIISVAPIIEQKAAGGVYWDEGIKPHTPKQMSEMKKTYIKLVLNNPVTFLQDRFNFFFKTCGIKNGGIQFVANPTLHRETLSEYHKKLYDVFRDDVFLNKPINEKLRMNVISLIDCRKLSDYDYKTPLNYIIYNPLLPILAVLWVLFISIKRKNYIYTAIGMLLLCIAAMVFVSAPQTHFFYYYSVYLCGYILFLLFLLLGNVNPIIPLKSAKKIIKDKSRGM